MRQKLAAILHDVITSDRGYLLSKAKRTPEGATIDGARYKHMLEQNDTPYEELYKATKQYLLTVADSVIERMAEDGGFPPLTVSPLEAIIDCYPDDEFLKPDGLEGAVIGVIDGVLAMSMSKAIAILEQDMDHEEAVDYFNFNVLGAYVGEKTPIWIDDTMF